MSVQATFDRHQASPMIGDVLVDFVVLQPGEWGRYASLPVHRHTVETLQTMGVTAIRFGGSFVSFYGGYYFWKYWRGAPWARPSVGAHWEQDVMSSWGPFEQIDLCMAMGIEPIITLTSQDQVPRHTGPYDCCTDAEMAEFIEYCYGNASTTYGLCWRCSNSGPQHCVVRPRYRDANTLRRDPPGAQAGCAFRMAIRSPIASSSSSWVTSNTTPSFRRRCGRGRAVTRTLHERYMNVTQTFFPSQVRSLRGRSMDVT